LSDSANIGWEYDFLNMKQLHGGPPLWSFIWAYDKSQDPVPVSSDHNGLTCHTSHETPSTYLLSAVLVVHVW